jgi:outer membrane protein OmpA-like peptidoglycan-associated protein
MAKEAKKTPKSKLHLKYKEKESKPAKAIEGNLQAKMQKPEPQDLISRQIHEMNKNMFKADGQYKEEKSNSEEETEKKVQKSEQPNILTAQQAQEMKRKASKTIKLNKEISFVSGTNSLTKKSKQNLKKVVVELKKYPKAEILIEGHTDSVGNTNINQITSEKRALTVATTLKKDYGIKNKISVIGKGESEPIASNKTKQGREKNRRIEIMLILAEK